MINLSKDDFGKLEFVGSGTFGKIYTDGVLTYKVYKNQVRTYYDLYSKNPMLKHLLLRYIRFNRLISLSQNIKKSDLISDILLLDDKFGGVVLPFYAGKELYYYLDTPLHERIAFSRQMIEISKELTDNFVYPTDFKLNNFIVTDSGIKAIDLDDLLTKVLFIKNSSLERKSILGLDATIKALLREKKQIVYYSRVADFLSKETEKHNESYESIVLYLDRKSQKYRYIFINEDSNIQDNLELLKDENNRVVYIFSEYIREDILLGKLNELYSLGIRLYDAVLKSNLDNYLLDIESYSVIEIEKERRLSLL